MKNKKFLMLLVSFVLMITMFVPVFAMKNVSTEIAFTVDGPNDGKVVIEAIDDAPLPEITEYKNVTEGSFKIEYSEPETYKYKVYQIAGTENDVKYDDTVYNVTVSVMTNDDGDLYTVVTICVGDDTHKPESIKFENVKNTTQSPSDPPQTGDNSNLMVYVGICCVSMFGFLACLLLSKKTKLEDK